MNSLNGSSLSKNPVRAIMEGIVLAVVWFLTAQAIEAAAAHSPARVAYGLISGWWAALYAAHFMGVTLARGTLICGGFFVTCFALRMMGLEWAHDPPARFDLIEVAERSALESLAFVSPVVANASVVVLLKTLFGVRRT